MTVGDVKGLGSPDYGWRWVGVRCISSPLPQRMLGLETLFSPANSGLKFADVHSPFWFHEVGRGGGGLMCQRRELTPELAFLSGEGLT